MREVINVARSLVSVIVPVYNVEEYLDRCVESIINQTYQNIEIILVDDGSPDRCPQMCDAWAEKDNRIKVIHKKNAGLGMARNTGIEHALGEYICFFDSDDYIAVETIEKAYILAKEKCAEIVVFGTNSVDRNGHITKQCIPESEKCHYTGADVQNIFLPDLIDNRHYEVTIKNLCLSACSCLFSMELIKRSAWRFVSERQIISEDSYSLIWLYKYVNTVVILPEALYFYCENGMSLTRRFREDRYEKIKQFYADCCCLSDRLEYSHQVRKRISGLFLSFSIAAMKQILMASLSDLERKALLAQIVNDETMQSVLLDTYSQYKSYARRLLFWAMRHKLHEIVYLLVKMQTRKSS